MIVHFSGVFTNRQAETMDGSSYTATAYCLKGRTASGIKARPGIVAADRKHHKLGSFIHLTAGEYSGKYQVADTGGAIKGRRLDIWMPCKQAKKFGKRRVRVLRRPVFC